MKSEYTIILSGRIPKSDTFVKVRISTSSLWWSLSESLRRWRVIGWLKPKFGSSLINRTHFCFQCLVDNEKWGNEASLNTCVCIRKANHWTITFFLIYYKGLRTNCIWPDSNWEVCVWSSKKYKRFRFGPNIYIQMSFFLTKSTYTSFWQLLPRIWYPQIRTDTHPLTSWSFRLILICRIWSNNHHQTVL